MTTPKTPGQSVQFTPGPWRYHLGRGANPRFHVQTNGGYQIVSTTELSPPQAFKENAEREANAKLIAAAPLLLEALTNLHDAGVDAQNIMADAGPPITKDQCIYNLIEALLAARKAVARATQ